LNRIDTAPPPTLLRFPAAFSHPRPARGPCGAEVARAIARGRRLQGEALRDGVRRLFGVLGGGSSLRRLRPAGGLPGKRQACC
jgi:hypothetical protein